MKRIGILTGGGDVPGLNSVIKSVVYRSSEVGWEALGIRRGWKGLTHVDTGLEDGGGFLRHARPRVTRAPSTAPAARCSTPRARTRRRLPGERCPRGWIAARIRAHGARRRSLRPHARSCSTTSRRSASRPHRHRWRRHAELRGSPRARGLPGDRHPQDDGQRRPRHRVLHRLLDRGDARQGAHQPPAHDAGQPRAHRRLPHLRPQRRLHRLVRRLRHERQLRHPRAAVRPRRAGRPCSPRIGASTRRTTPSSSPAKARSGGAARSRRSATPMRTATATRRTSARRWPTS